MSINRKYKEYMKAIERNKAKYEKEMWDEWKLKGEFE